MEKNLIGDIVNSLWESEKVKLENYYKEKIAEKEKEIELLKQEHKIHLQKACNIEWDETGKFYNLSDFCRVTRDLFFIKENQIKQYLYQKNFLVKDNGKYIPAPNQDICRLIDNKIFVKYDYIRQSLIFLRTLVCIGDEDVVKNMLEEFSENKGYIIEEMANTVYIECKQRSNEFRYCKENQYFLKLNQIKEIKYEEM